MRSACLEKLVKNQIRVDQLIALGTFAFLPSMYLILTSYYIYIYLENSLLGTMLKVLKLVLQNIIRG